MTFAVVTLLSILVQSDCAKVLGIFNIPSISHQIVFQPIWKELSLRGHDVTVLTTDPLHDPTLRNLTEVDLSVLYESLKPLRRQMVGVMNNWSWTRSLDGFATASTRSFFAHHEVQKLIRDKSRQFDLVLTEMLFPAPAVFAVQFNCPLMGISSLPLPAPIHEMLGTPVHPFLYPDYCTNFGEELTFFEKVGAVLFYWYHRYKYFYEILPELDREIKKYFGKSTPVVKKIVSKNLSMVLLNTNPILHKPRPLGPNVIEIGRNMHLKPIKPLPQDLQKFLDNSTKGVIYFSLGTNVKSALMEATKKHILTKVFSELPYKILWKYEGEHMEGKPKNVKISQWFPQQDLLGHKNLKLFIMQGGLQSTEEAIARSVPLLVIPFFVDQFDIAERVEALGVGQRLDFGALTKQSFKSAIVEVIENKRYKQRMVEVRRLLNDESAKGLEKAIWWIEYVIRNKGALHFRNRLVDLAWYEYLMLDVYGFLVVVGFVVCFVIYKTFGAFIKGLVFASVSRKVKIF